MPWTPPVGIPSPSWGALGNPIDLPTPTMPEDWTENIPGYYYVKYLAGADGNVDDYLTGSGYPGNPMGIIPYNYAPAGSIIFIEGDIPWNHTAGLGCIFEGTEADPIWMVDAGVAESPARFTGVFQIKPHTAGADRSGYLLTDGVSWATLEVGVGLHHSMFRNGTVDPNEAESSGILLYEQSSWTNTTEQLVIYNMTVKNCGDWQVMEGDPDKHGISVQTYQQDIWIVDNTIFHCSGCAVQLVSGPNVLDAAAAHRIYVGRNTGYETNQTAFWSKRSVDCVFSQNIAHDVRRDNPLSTEMCGLGGQYGQVNLWLIYNTVYSCQAGIFIASDTSPTEGLSVGDVHIIGNVIYNIHDTQSDAVAFSNPSKAAGVAIGVWGGTVTRIVNNTIHDYDGGIYCRFGQERSIRGNIMMGRNDALAGRDMLIETASGSSVIDYNIIEEVDSEIYLVNGASTYTTVSGLNASALGDNNSATLPTFVNAAGGNFRLAAASNGIDDFTTTQDQVYTDFNSLYSLSIKFDNSGGVRPWDAVGETSVGASWDIGAYEYGASAPPPPPPAPTFSIDRHITPSSP